MFINEDFMFRFCVSLLVFNLITGEQSWEVRSMGSLRSLIETRDTRPDLKSVPRMSQPHFIMLWKTVYDLFQAQPEDQETFHSIATIGMWKISDYNQRGPRKVN